MNNRILTFLLTLPNRKISDLRGEDGFINFFAEGKRGFDLSFSSIHVSHSEILFRCPLFPFFFVPKSDEIKNLKKKGLTVRIMVSIGI